MKRLLLALIISTPFANFAVAGPHVTIVQPEKPSPLEARAVALLTTQLKQLFDATTQTLTVLPTTSAATIIVGRPESSAAISGAIGKQWPTLSEQGHVVRTLSKEPPVLLLGGGSDLATYWAVCEFGQLNGVRYLPTFDVYPTNGTPLELIGHDRVLEPRVRQRAFSAFTPSPLGTVYWGADDWQTLLTQMSKLKFNRLQTNVAPRSAIGLFSAGAQPLRILLERDAPGRRAFRDSLIFGHPQLTSNAAAAAEAEFISSVFDQAQACGILPLTPQEPRPSSRLELYQSKLGAFPQSRLHRLFDAANEAPRGEAATVAWSSPDDALPGVWLASRQFWNDDVTVKNVCHNLFATIAGREDVAERMQLALDHLEQTDDKLERMLRKHQLSCEPGPEMFTQFLKIDADLEPAWKEILAGFISANNELLRAHGNAPGPTRPLFFYYTKRGELSIHLTNCHIALAAAAKARQAKQADTEIEQIEKALESLYMGLNGLSEVALNQSDRGIIAALNEYGYKPLNKELERLTQ